MLLYLIPCPLIRKKEREKMEHSGPTNTNYTSDKLQIIQSLYIIIKYYTDIRSLL